MPDLDLDLDLDRSLCNLSQHHPRSTYLTPFQAPKYAN